MGKIVIQISGGCLIGVHAYEKMDVVLIDHDNLKAGANENDSPIDSEELAEKETKGLIEIF